MLSVVSHMTFLLVRRPIPLFRSADRRSMPTRCNFFLHPSSCPISQRVRKFCVKSVIGGSRRFAHSVVTSIGLWPSLDANNSQSTLLNRPIRVSFVPFLNSCLNALGYNASLWNGFSATLPLGKFALRYVFVVDYCIGGG